MLVVATLCSLASTCIYVSAECQIADHQIYFHEETRLRKTLFKDYDHKMPAVVKSFNFTDESHSKYEVLLTLTYIRLINVDGPQQKAEFNTDYSMNWRDERLQWNPKNYCGMDHIYVLSSDVWFPDITFVTAHSTADYPNDQHKFVRLNSSGHLYLDLTSRTDTDCATETQNFPFDRQKCYIIIKSALFFDCEYGIKIAFSPRLYNIFTFDGMGNEEWQVENLTGEQSDRSFEIVAFILIPKSGNSSSAAVQFERCAGTVPGLRDQYERSLRSFRLCCIGNNIAIWMRRCPSFYITMIIIPSFVTNILSIIGILTKADIMGKLGMALTSIMSLSLILGILATSLPRSERLPKIVIYVMTNLLIVVFALVAAFVLSCLKEIHSHSCEGNESDGRKLNENKRYRKAAYVLIAMFEMANLINLIVLIA